MGFSHWVFIVAGIVNNLRLKYKINTGLIFDSIEVIGQVFFQHFVKLIVDNLLVKNNPKLN